MSFLEMDVRKLYLISCGLLMSVSFFSNNVNASILNTAGNILSKYNSIKSLISIINVENYNTKNDNNNNDDNYLLKKKQNSSANKNPFKNNKTKKNNESNKYFKKNDNVKNEKDSPDIEDDSIFSKIKDISVNALMSYLYSQNIPLSIICSTLTPDVIEKVVSFVTDDDGNNNSNDDKKNNNSSSVPYVNNILINFLTNIVCYKGKAGLFYYVAENLFKMDNSDKASQQNSNKSNARKNKRNKRKNNKKNKNNNNNKKGFFRSIVNSLF